MEMLFGDLSKMSGRIRHTLARLSGIRHDWQTLPSAPQPGQPVDIEVMVGIDAAVNSLRLMYTVDGSLPSSQSGSTANVEMYRCSIDWNEMVWAYTEIWRGQIPAQSQGILVQYSIVALLDSGGLSQSRAGHPGARVRSAPVFGYYVSSRRPPSWLSESVIYQLMPDRFHPGPQSEFQQVGDLTGIVGGTISGIVDKLDYLTELGINCIWMTPIFPSPAHHGYDATAYDTIEPRLGTDSQFEQLVDELKSRGIKLILDFVANHVSSHHPFFQSAIIDRQSKYADWFLFKRWPDQYDSYYALPHMPILNGDNPEVSDYLIGQALTWLGRGVDGFRLDHAHGLSHLFWSRFRRAIEEKYPDAIMIGEVTLAPDAIKTYVGRMDGCLDFKFAELVRNYFALQRLKTSEFARQIERHLSFSSNEMRNPTFLDNHDMNRFLWSAGGDRRKLRMAALFQFCLPSPPVIYYGTETGLSQRKTVGRLEEARLPMNWDELPNNDLLSFYKSLIAFRKRIIESAISGPISIVMSDDKLRVFVMRIGKLLLVCNNRRTKAHVSLDSDLLRHASFLIGSDARIKLSSEALEIPPYAAAALSIS